MIFENKIYNDIKDKDLDYVQIKVSKKEVWSRSIIDIYIINKLLITFNKLDERIQSFIEAKNEQINKTNNYEYLVEPEPKEGINILLLIN